MELAKISFRNVRNGLFIFNNYRKYMKSQFYDADQLREIQENKFKILLQEVLTYVPYYKKMKLDIDFQKFDLNVLKQFPIVNKEIIKANYNDFLSTKISKNQIEWKATSGSSGVPFKVAKAYYSDGIEQCMMYRAWSMREEYTYSLYDPCIVLRSYSPKVGEPVYKIDKILNYWYLSPFDINEKNLLLYLKIINESKAKLLRGYPSSIYILTLLLKEKGIKIPQIKTLFTSSENLIPLYKKTIEEYWGIPIIDWYGQNERTVTVQMCSHGNYHNNDEYGMIELDSTNQVIATSINNNVMPLIRYATNDIVVPSKIGRCSCGRGLSIPFSCIDGRADDLLVREDDTLIATVNIYNAFEKYPFVKQFKITQLKNKNIELQLTENVPLSIDYILQIESELTARLGNVKIETQIVKEISRNQQTEKIKTIESLLIR